uniref:BED-type domain-containing protein n=1 Tax=Amphimedon queenslandica TaxID=400682 RepID=A0A1X7UPQ4_AMPQE
MAAISGEASYTSEEAEEIDLNDDPTLPPSIGSTTTTSSDEVLSARLLPKPGTKSAIWQYFGVKANEDGEVLDDGKAFCRLCSRGVIARSGNTSNLMAHLCNNHKPRYSLLRTSASKPIKAKPQAQDQPTISSLFLHSQPYSRHGKRWKELTDSVTRFLVKDELPMYSVQKDGFRQMLKTFGNRHEIPDQSYFSRTAVPELYAITRKRVAEQVAEQVAAVRYFASIVGFS